MIIKIMKGVTKMSHLSNIELLRIFIVLIISFSAGIWFGYNLK